MQCELCTSAATLMIEAEEDQKNPKPACTAHAGLIATNVIDVWGEHGVICVYRA